MCHLVALLGGNHILQVSRVSVKYCVIFSKYPIYERGRGMDTLAIKSTLGSERYLWGIKSSLLEQIVS